MFRHLAEVRPDVALIEVGLGGRLDATHAWDGGVAVVTNVTLDHTDRLGTTVAAIAREKAAIIERGDVAVTASSGEAHDVVRRRCARLDVPLVTVTPPPIIGWDRDGIEVELPRLGVVRVGLRGRHQAVNVAVADALLDALESHQLFGGHEESRHIGWVSHLQLSELGQTGVVLAFLVQLHRQAVAKECVGRIVSEHRFDLFAS